MFWSLFDLPNAIGAGSLLISLITYCLLRRLLSATPQTPARLYWAARLCLLCGALKLGVGIFEITFFKDAGGIYWGWLLLLVAVLWLIRGSKLRRRARIVSAGYLAFNDNGADANANINANANASNAMNANAPIKVAIDSNSSSKKQLSQSLIRNAVPPSPFSSCPFEGNELYPLPSIPMIRTNSNAAETLIRPSTPGHSVEHSIDDVEEEEKIVNTLDHREDAEDSIYVDEVETPSGGPQTPERKTSEGNTTMC